MRQCWRVAAAALIALMGTLMVIPGHSFAASTPLPGSAGLQLLGQTPFVESSGSFHVDLKVTAPNPSIDKLQTVVYSRLTSRSDFDQAMANRPRGYQQWSELSNPVATLNVAASGGVGIDIPVNGPTGHVLSAHSGSSVYPVSFQLYSGAGVPMGKALTTFLVYSAGPSPSSPRLSVSLTVPVSGPADGGPTVTRLPASSSAALASLAATLAAYSTVPVTLAVAPEVLDRLAAGTLTDRNTLASLARSAGPDQVLAAPYYPVNPGALSAAGLDGELQAQYAAGAAAIFSGLRRHPDIAAAVVAGRLDDTSLGALISTGVSRLVVPDADLSQLSAAQRQITFAVPTSLAAARGPVAAVVGADAGLSALLTPSSDPVLAGEQLLAGLSLVQLEAPSDARGVALLTPSDAAVNPTVLGVVLSGLDANPLLAPVTADGLFRSVPAATPAVTRTLVGARSPAPLTQAAAVHAARVALDGLSGIAPSQARSLVPLERQLLYATSLLVTAGGRSQVLAGVQASVKRVEAGISLPGSSSITLTARTGTIPLTVLSNPALHAHVQLRIVSPKLTFRPFTTSLGSCAVTDAASEDCQLTLTSEATTLRVPVEARTGGVFAMLVTLSSPNGEVVLASNRDTVRSTAFSEVGVVLILVAAFGLIGWWVRNARHGRRARQLIDPSTEVIRLPDLEDVASPGNQDAAARAGIAVPRTSPSRPPARPSRPPGEDDQPAVVAPPGGPPPAWRPPPAVKAPVGAPLPPFPESPLGPPAAPAATWMDADPVISEFFSSPAPEYGDQPDSGGRPAGGAQVSPSGRRRSPNS